MGNPKLKQPHPTEAAPPGEAFNGILGRVPGDYVARAKQMLPKPGPEHEAQPVREVVLEVPDLGMVRITLRLNWHKPRRSKFWRWDAERADRVP